MVNLPKRCLFFILGIMLNSLGVAFITKAALGTSTISSISYVFSLKFTQISFGMHLFILNLIFIALEIIILRKKFHPAQFLQIVANILMSTFIDLSMYALNWFSPENIILRFVCVFIGCVILAFGISFEVSANVLMISGEGLVKAIADTTGLKFGKAKAIFDITLIVLAAIFSFIFFGKLNGIGIGTIISTVIVGPIILFLDRKLPIFKAIQAMSERSATTA